MNGTSLIIFSLFLSQVLLSKELDKPALSIELNVIPAHAVSVYDKEILSFVPRRDTIVLTPFKGLQDNREKTFGSFLDSQKFRLKDKKRNFLAHFGHKIDHRILIIDGEAMNTALYSTKDKRIWRFGDIIYDQIKPHADRGGEATSVETASMRSRFKKDVRNTTGRKLSYGRLVPEALRKGKSKDGIQFLVSTSLKSAPIVSMRCDDESYVNCLIERRCNFSRKGISGLAFDVKKKHLLVALKNSVRVYKYNSCSSMTFVQEIKVTRKLPDLSDIAVDANRSLWITTVEKDFVSHGSVFVWPESKWD